MSITSSWPLPTNGVRFITPQPVASTLARHPIAGQLYPNSLGYYPEAQGHLMERTTQDDYILIYCIAGKGEIQIADTPARPIHPGDVVLLPPRLARHRYIADPDKPWTIYWFHYTGHLAAHLTEQLGQYYDLPSFHYGVDGTLVEDFKRLLRIRDTGYQFRALLNTCALLQQILTQLLIPNTTRHPGDQGQLNALQHFMKQNLNAPLTLDDFAAFTGLSKYHLTREYKRLTGYPPLQHFQHLKMEHACLLLDQSSQPIKDIAGEIGFQDPYYFSRQFKKIIGLSPKAYRKLSI